MNRDLNCANVRALGNAHSHITPESRSIDRTLPAQNSLKAVARAVIDRTMSRTLPAQSEKTARTLPAQSRPECEGNLRLLSDDFRVVATWWQWSADDVEHFRSWAKSNRDAAAAWIAAEADTVRRYADQLHVASVGEFIKQKRP